MLLGGQRTVFNQIPDPPINTQYRRSGALRMKENRKQEGPGDVMGGSFVLGFGKHTFTIYYMLTNISGSKLSKNTHILRSAVTIQ